MSEAFERQRLSFGAAADAYDVIRPSYPAQALEWALGTAPIRVVDLGAGTGLLTRLLIQLGHEVTAVEPDPKMRHKLTERLPDCAVVAGSAEQIPLAGGAADAVVAGQAYHWFDPEPAHAEIARVLRPCGVFAPLWNLRDESVDWVARLSRLIDEFRSSRGEGVPVDAFGDAFGPVERRDFQHDRPHTPASLLALIRSQSWYLTATENRRRQIDNAVRALADGLPQSFDVPYVTRVYRATRLSSRSY
ncbi:Methyltransferase domain-containing protein [Nonomuraea solani]|uniref:Methyltransferase domain-containing protein n=1 Tax=Nonomuraea solani TaxID=1144553 RepID=A0A1H6EUH5_9ACTN|nr:class I SAM-dependent methyltransferase [Nonomuraea solani]SEH00344.1 Methyltransferase domain-containing protein [Nonomuraea solani]